MSITYPSPNSTNGTFSELQKMLQHHDDASSKGAYIYDLTIDRHVVHQRMTLSDLHPRRQIEFRNNLFGSNITYNEIFPWTDIAVEDIHDDLWIIIFNNFLQYEDISLCISHCCKYFYNLTQSAAFNNHWKAKSIQLIHHINDNKFLVQQCKMHLFDHRSYYKEFYAMNIPLDYKSKHWLHIYHQLKQYITIHDILMYSYKQYYKPKCVLTEIACGGNQVNALVHCNYSRNLFRRNDKVDYLLYAGLPLMYQMIRFDLVLLFEMFLVQFEQLNMKYDKCGKDSKNNTQWYCTEFDFLQFTNITPLRIAIRYGSDHMIEYLLKNCICHQNVNVGNSNPNYNRNCCNVGFNICQMMQIATQCSDIDTFVTPMSAIILTGCYSDANDHNSDNRKKRMVSIGRKILDHLTRCINVITRSISTNDANYSYNSKHTSVVGDIVNEPLSMGYMNLLHFAVAQGYTEMVSLLLKYGADINAFISAGKSDKQCYVNHDHDHSLLDSVIGYGFEQSERDIMDGNFWLLNKRIENSLQMMKYLVWHKDFRINTVHYNYSYSKYNTKNKYNFKKNELIDIVSACSYSNIYHVLAYRLAQYNDKDDDNSSDKYYTCIKRHQLLSFKAFEMVVQRLLANEVNGGYPLYTSIETILKCKSDNGNNILYYACINGHYDILVLILDMINQCRQNGYFNDLEKQKLLQTFLNNSCTYNETKHIIGFGETPYLATWQQIARVHWNSNTCDTSTNLHIESYTQHFEKIIRLLVFGFGVNVSIQTNNGMFGTDFASNKNILLHLQQQLKPLET